MGDTSSTITETPSQQNTLTKIMPTSLQKTLMSKKNPKNKQRSSHLPNSTLSTHRACGEIIACNEICRHRMIDRDIVKSWYKTSELWVKESTIRGDFKNTLKKKLVPKGPFHRPVLKQTTGASSSTRLMQHTCTRNRISSNQPTRVQHRYLHLLRWFGIHQDLRDAQRCIISGMC